MPGILGQGPRGSVLHGRVCRGDAREWRCRRGPKARMKGDSRRLADKVLEELRAKRYPELLTSTTDVAV